MCIGQPSLNGGLSDQRTQEQCCLFVLQSSSFNPDFLSFNAIVAHWEAIIAQTFIAMKTRDKIKENVS